MVLRRRELAARAIEREQGSRNRFKSICTSTVLQHFGIYRSEYRYSQLPGDVESILRRKGYSVRSRKSQAGKVSVGGLRQKIKAGKIDLANCRRILVRVKGHVLLLDREGNTVVDTDPRKVDRRPVLGVYIVSVSY